MNKWIGIGRLTKDAETSYSQNGMAIARFTLAVDRRQKKDGQQDADFIRCVAFNKTAEFCDKYARKGVKFAVDGHVQNGSYTKDNGEKVYTTDIIVESMEFCESKNSNQPAKAEDGDGFMNIPDGLDEELPFA